MTTAVREQVGRRLAAAGYRPVGNCFEAALACGVLLAGDPDRVVRLAKGAVRGVTHWWVVADGEVVDPTAGQFDPPPAAGEYRRERYDGVDLHALSCLLSPEGCTCGV